MIFKSEAISEGIHFSAIDSNKFKSSVITFSITMPLTQKAVAYNLLLSGLLRRGTKKYPSMAKLNRSLDELYGSYLEIRSAHVGYNLAFTISAEVLDNKYIPDGIDAIGGVIDTVADIILCPKIKDEDFKKEFFEQECNILIDSLNSEYNNTRAYSIRRCLEILQKDSQNPTLEQLKDIVKNARFDDVLDHYKNMICSAPLDVFYIGTTPSEDIKKCIASSFENYPCKMRKAELNPVVPHAFTEIESRTEKMPVIQGKLSMGFNCGACISNDSDRYYTALLLNELFGGAPSSKLFINVREKMSLCYYCSSSFSIYTGFIMVSSGIEVEKLEIVKSAILDQLEELKKGNISVEEINAAKKSLSNGYKQLYDSAFDLQAFYNGRALFGISDTVEDCIDNISRISKEDIVSLANEIKLQAVFFVEGTEGGDGEEDEQDE